MSIRTEEGEGRVRVMCPVRASGEPWYVLPYTDLRETRNLPFTLGQRRFQDKEEIERQSFRCDAEKTRCKNKGREEEPEKRSFLIDRFNSLVEYLGGRTQRIIAKK